MDCKTTCGTDGRLNRVMDFQREALMSRALGDENRLRILALLQNGELCACKLLVWLDITQPTLSHHMKILCDAGLVTPRKDGKWTHYAVSPAGGRLALSTLEQILHVKEP